MGHDDAPEGPRQVAGSENAERLALPEPGGNFRWEKYLAYDVGEKDKDDEIIELQAAS